jgi:hypothetical protein
MFIKKLKNTKYKIVTSIAILLIATISIFGYYVAKPILNIEKVVQNAQGVDNRGVVVWDYLTENGFKQVICKKDLLNPEVVTLTKPKGENDGVFAFYTTLYRQNLFQDFQTNNYQGSVGSSKFSELNIDKVAQLYEKKGCDHYKKSGKIDDQNVTYNPPLTPEEIKKSEEANAVRLETNKILEEQRARPLTSRLESSIKGLLSLEERLELLKQGITEYNGKPIDPPYVDQFQVRVDARKLAIKTMKKILANEELTPEEKAFADDNGYFNNVQ